MTQVKKVQSVVEDVGKPKVDMAAKFVELAQKRVAKAMTAIRSVGGLAAPRYKYTPEQVATIAHALQTELDTVHAEFTVAKTNKGIRFTL